MSTAIYPPLEPASLRAAEKQSTANELAWLLTSLQESLLDLKSGLEECYALLAPIEPGSTLVLSSPRSESIKGHVTRVGTLVVKGQITLRLKTQAPLALTLNPTSTTPISIPALDHLRTLLNQSLDCIDITRWTGDRHSASFISAQMRLLASILAEASAVLRGFSTSTTTAPATSTELEIDPGTEFTQPAWYTSPPPATSFSPPLPANLSFHLTLTPPSLCLTIRVLEPTAIQPHALTKFAFAIGAQRRLEHDEMDEIFVYRGEEVRVREKVVLESAADPGLLSLGAKVGWLARGVGGLRGGLEGVISCLDS